MRGLCGACNVARRLGQPLVQQAQPAKLRVHESGRRFDLPDARAPVGHAKYRQRIVTEHAFQVRDGGVEVPNRVRARIG